jgi:very-short-patch-repair endonuclease
MARKPIPLDVDDLIRRYEAGESAKHLADERGVYVYYVTRWLRETGVNLRSASESERLAWRTVRHRAIDGLPVEPIRRLYIAGVSGKVLADAFDVNRTAINALLRRLGVPIRNRSEGMSTRWETGGESAQRLLGAAWAARSGRAISNAEKAHRAIGRSRNITHVGRHETELTQAILAHGVSAIQQMAVGPYNVDVALDVDRIAVEIYTSGIQVSTQGGRRPLQRVKYLLDEGWTVLHVNTRRYFDLAPLCEYVVALTEAVRRDEARWRGYGMVRGDGKPAPRRGSQFDQFPHIPRAHP